MSKGWIIVLRVFLYMWHCRESYFGVNAFSRWLRGWWWWTVWGQSLERACKGVAQVWGLKTRGQGWGQQMGHLRGPDEDSRDGCGRRTMQQIWGEEGRKPQSIDHHDVGQPYSASAGDLSFFHVHDRLHIYTFLYWRQACVWLKFCNHASVAKITK